MLWSTCFSACYQKAVECEVTEILVYNYLNSPTRQCLWNYSHISSLTVHKSKTANINARDQMLVDITDDRH